MNSRDPKITALLFNECINRRDVAGLAALMSDDHAFIDRENRAVRPKGNMVQAWKTFFALYPEYKNTFVRVDSRDDLVILLGFASWDKNNRYDHAIWTAKIENDLVA